MGCWVFKLHGEADGTLRPEGVGWSLRTARSLLLLAPPGEGCLGPLDVTSAPGGLQLRRAKAKAGAYEEKRQRSPLPCSDYPTTNQPEPSTYGLHTPSLEQPPSAGNWH
jgi:hypothetical protein